VQGGKGELVIEIRSAPGYGVGTGVGVPANVGGVGVGVGDDASQKCRHAVHASLYPLTAAPSRQT
jgi:hypothetical protein